MTLDWQDVKGLFIEGLAADGDTVVPITSGSASSTVSVASNGVPAVGTITDTRAQLMLRIFTSITRYLRTSGPVGVYLAAGDWAVDLSDTSTPKCDVGMCYVTNFWLNGSPLSRFENVRQALGWNNAATASQGSPSGWVRRSKTFEVQFNVPCETGLTGTFAEGYYYHPTILYDTAAAALAVPATTITGATTANPIVIHDVAHGYLTGQQVVIAGVGGITEANGTWTVTKIDADHFSLNQSQGIRTYTSGGTASRPASAGQCQLAIEDVFTFAKFAQVNVKEGIVDAETSLARLSKFDKQAAMAMGRLNAKAIRADLQGGW